MLEDMLQFNIELESQEFSYPSFRLFAKAHLIDEDDRHEVGRARGGASPTGSIFGTECLMPSTVVRKIWRI
jgi:hypothetical protein